MKRFWAKVQLDGSIPDLEDCYRPVEGPCWLWLGAISHDKYGVFWIQGKVRPAHVLAYIAYAGSLPKGLVVDHLCRNMRCVNPDHMEPVTPGENTLRMVPFRLKKPRTCKWGHPLAGDNLTGGKRQRCRTCRNSESRERKRVVREQAHGH